MIDDEIEKAAPPPEPKKKAEPPRKMVSEWAAAKGHVPCKRPASSFRGDQVHRGPHVRVVRFHNKWPENLLLSEAEYDAGVRAAYDIPLGESPTKPYPRSARKRG
jgi:hypothetical protein